MLEIVAQEREDEIDFNPPRMGDRIFKPVEFD
jgi:hypothetical protein